MKLSTILGTLVLGAGLTATSLLANSVTLSHALTDAIQATTSNDGTFDTFCVEKAVVAHSGNQGYTYTIDNKIQLLDQNLTAGTAWLYESFRNGSVIDGAGLQVAFWILQGQTPVVANAYIGLVTTHFGSLALAQVDSTDTSVQVLNIWGPHGQDIQSQLILVPDSGTTTALLGLGLLSLAFIRRKL